MAAYILPNSITFFFVLLLSQTWIRAQIQNSNYIVEAVKLLAKMFVRGLKKPLDNEWVSIVAICNSHGQPM